MVRVAVEPRSSDHRFGIRAISMAFHFLFFLLSFFSASSFPFFPPRKNKSLRGALFRDPRWLRRARSSALLPNGGGTWLKKLGQLSCAGRGTIERCCTIQRARFASFADTFRRHTLRERSEEIESSKFTDSNDNSRCDAFEIFFFGRMPFLVSLLSDSNEKDLRRVKFRHFTSANREHRISQPLGTVFNFLVRLRVVGTSCNERNNSSISARNTTLFKIISNLLSAIPWIYSLLFSFCFAILILLCISILRMK